MALEQRGDEENITIRDDLQQLGAPGRRCQQDAPLIAQRNVKTATK